MRLPLILSVLTLCLLTASWGQMLPPNDLGVSMSEVRLIVADVEANRRFWTLLGGIPIKVDGTEVMKFPGVFLFLTLSGSPSSNNEGSVVNHFGFSVPNVKEYCGKWKAEGVTLCRGCAQGRRRRQRCQEFVFCVHSRPSENRNQRGGVTSHSDCQLSHPLLGR